MNDQMSAVTRRLATHKMGDGREIVLHSLGLRDFVSAREQALQEYKREKIKTWTANLDLIPEEQRQEWLREAFQKAELISYEDLPEKQIDMPVHLPNGQVKRDGTGAPIFQRSKVEYAMWWMSDTPSGRLYMTWLSMRKDASQSDLTLEDADQLFIDSLSDLENAAQLVGDLSNPKMGNPEAPQATTEGRNKRRRRRRRTGH